MTQNYTITTGTTTNAMYYQTQPNYIWPQPVYVPYPVEPLTIGDKVSKFEQAFKVASKLIAEGLATTKNIEEFVKLVNLIHDEL